VSYSVVIPSRNLANLTACVGALRAAGETCRVIVVWDGAVMDALKPYGTEKQPILFYLKHGPFIFARNVNIGIRLAGDDDVVILNDDALLETPGGLARLEHDAEYFNENLDPEYGIVAASCDVCGTPEQVHCDVRYVPDGEHYAVEPTVHAAPLMVAFICVYIPRRVIDLVGLLDERFCVNAGGEGPRGYGCEDDDYCWRVRKAGLKLGIDNDVVVNHTKLRSTFRGDPAHPADVRLHEKVFEDKWGVSPRTGKPSWRWAPAVNPDTGLPLWSQRLEKDALLHKTWAADLEAWRKAQEVSVLGALYVDRFSLQEKWEGEGPHDFRPGSARMVCGGVFLSCESVRDSGPLQFKAIFGATAEMECRAASEQMESRGMRPAVERRGDGFWIITWSVEI